jgi:hypothetical protein
MFKIQITLGKSKLGFVRDYHIGKFYVMYSLVPAAHTGIGYSRFTFRVESYL